MSYSNRVLHSVTSRCWRSCWSETSGVCETPGVFCVSGSLALRCGASGDAFPRGMWEREKPTGPSALATALAGARVALHRCPTLHASRMIVSRHSHVEYGKEETRDFADEWDLFSATLKVINVGTYQYAIRSIDRNHHQAIRHRGRTH